MNQAVILLCGVPGSGKTWVLDRLHDDKFTIVRNDDYIGHAPGHLAGVVAVCAKGQKPVIVDCPFGERLVKDALEARGLEVYPFVIVEDPDVVAERYEAREGKPASKTTLARAYSISARADEWNAPRGTSSEILEHLLELRIKPA